MRHDYNFPPDWEAMTNEEKNEWFHQERARRQATSQDTNFNQNHEKGKERRDRRVGARNETRDVKE